MSAAVSNIKSIIEDCVGCGLCESVCKNDAIKVKSEHGVFRPTIDDSKCVNCGICLRCCPANNMESFKHNDFPSVCYGHSKNKKLRYMAASGGVVSEILSHLLRTKEVDYVLTADEYRNDENCQYCVISAEDGKKEIADKAGSNYCPVNMGKAIRHISENEGKCAIVCLPCLARGIAKYSEINKAVAEKIQLVVVLLCNHTPPYTATNYVMGKKHIPMKRISRVKFRGEGWNYTLRGYSADSNKPLFKDHKYWDRYFSKYFWQKGCVDCDDHFGKYGDICAGDADFVKFRDKHTENAGETVCFVNSERGRQILERMNGREIEISYDVTAEELETVYGANCEYNFVTYDNMRGDALTILKGDMRYILKKEASKIIKTISPGLHRYLKKRMG